ncbi:MAG TPA: hypothetical protein VF388_07015 [Lacunisphaera sp.]
MLFFRRLVWPLCAALLVTAALRGEEQNGWPLFVHQTPPDASADSEQWLGPLIFSKHAAGEVNGFRPFYLHAEVDGKESNAFLYPFFTWERQPGFRKFSFFQLVNVRHTDEPGEPADHGFDVWPFYFSRETGDPATSYHAFFPIAGTVKYRFGRDELSWVVFPLYMHSRKSGREVTTALWPFLTFIDGAGHHGFEFWPLFGRRGRANDYERQFYLWPFIYKSASHLDQPVPTVSEGFLPFYTRDTGPGLISETYLWPFFGYTHRTEPYRYEERRYFWPFFVQGLGDQRAVNRWAPFYTRSVIKGYDKKWVLWPFYRHAEWTDDNRIEQEKNQFLYFIYWSQTQRSLTNPQAAPANKRHLWPLFSAWDNGAGRRQVQVLSPLEIFFPTNDVIRQVYTPLFALYRYDQPDATTARHSLLWNAITWSHTATDRSFHLGPLFSVQSGADQKRVAFGLGLFGWQRGPGETRSRFFLFDFARKPANKTVAPSTP